MRGTPATKFYEIVGNPEEDNLTASWRSTLCTCALEPLGFALTFCILLTALPHLQAIWETGIERRAGQRLHDLPLSVAVTVGASAPLVRTRGD